MSWPAAAQGLHIAKGVLADRQAERNRQPFSGAAHVEHGARRPRTGDRSDGRELGERQGGRPRVLLISGEPGIGKSRMVQTLLYRLKDEPHVRLRLFCAPNRQGTPLYPVIRQLQRATGIGSDDTITQKLDKLEATLGRATADLAEPAPLIAELLSIPTEGRFRRSSSTPEVAARQDAPGVDGPARRTCAATALMALEDVHWIDATSLSFLTLVVDRAPKAAASSPGHFPPRVRLAVGRPRSCDRDYPRSSAAGAKRGTDRGPDARQGVAWRDG